MCVIFVKCASIDLCYVEAPVTNTFGESGIALNTPAPGPSYIGMNTADQLFAIDSATEGQGCPGPGSLCTWTPNNQTHLVVPIWRQLEIVEILYIGNGWDCGNINFFLIVWVSR